MKIRIEDMYDEYDCETCGYSVAYGGRIFFDEELKFELIPVAHCYDSVTIMDPVNEFWAKKVLELLGHELEVVQVNARD